MGRYLLIIFLFSATPVLAVSHQISVTATVLPSPEWEALQASRSATFTHDVNDSHDLIAGQVDPGTQIRLFFTNALAYLTAILTNS